MIIIKICYFDFHCADSITCWESSGNIDEHIENIDRERDRERELTILNRSSLHL